MNFVKRFCKIFLPSILVAIFPVIFLYNNNATKLYFQSIFLPLSIMFVITLLVTGVSLLVNKSSDSQALIESIIFLIFFYFYGTTYDFLLKRDVFQIEHITFLPIYFFLVFLIIEFIKKFIHSEGKYLFFGTELLFGGLILFNFLGIIPIELQKIKSNQVGEESTSPAVTKTNFANRPDVYYIVFDESVGFDAMRTYWKYDKVDDFENFLKSKGFFVAEGSRSKTHETMIELASRLNFEDMSLQKGFSALEWFDAISNNKVMQLFKSYGYTTIVLDQVKAANGYVNKTPMTADYNLSSNNVYSGLGKVDDFFFLVFNRSMLRPFCDRIHQSDPLIIQHRNDVQFFFDKLAHLDEFPSPKFVYAQVLLTHVPLIFDENGNMVDAKYYYDWNYYLESYKYEITRTTQLINSILEQADPKNPPIILIQSDHGFRNILDGHPGSTVLPNYPDEYKYEIINALLLPGYDTSQLPDNLNPTDTFPIILNHYFNENIPLQ